MAALKLDDIIGLPGRLSEEQISDIRQHYSDEEIAELALGVGLFMGMSGLITLGLDMDITVIPTPGSQS